MTLPPMTRLDKKLTVVAAVLAVLATIAVAVALVGA